MIIPDKDVMYKLLLSGAFGNTLPAWDNINDVISAGIQDVAIRCKIPRKEFVYYKPIEQIIDDIKPYCIRNGVQQNQLLFYAKHDEADRIISGEFSADERSSILHYSFGNGNMRIKMDEGPHFKYRAFGLYANNVLRTYLNNNQVDWLWHLCREYENPIIEFTLFDKKLGTLHDEMIMWEVRHY